MTTPEQSSPTPWIKVLLGAALVASISITAVPVRAQDAYGCIDELSEAELDYRIHKIEKNFEDGQQKAAAWRFGWIFAMAGSTTLGAYNLANRHAPRAERFFEWALLGGGIATVAQLAIIPMPDVWGAKRIRRKPGSTIEEKRAKLRYATKTLEKSATVQGYIGGTNYGGGGITYGVVMGSLYLGLYHDEYAGLPSPARRRARLRAAGLYLLPPTLSISQAMTHPMHSYMYWEEYRGTACSGKYYDTGGRGPEFDLDFGLMNLTMKVTF